MMSSPAADGNDVWEEQAGTTATQKKGKAPPATSYSSPAPAATMPVELCRRSGRKLSKPARYAAEENQGEQPSAQEAEEEDSKHAATEMEVVAPTEQAPVVVTRKRGRPPGSKSTPKAAAGTTDTTNGTKKETRGRKKKTATTTSSTATKKKEATTKRAGRKKKEEEEEEESPIWDPIYNKGLASAYPDPYWKSKPAINRISQKHPLKLLTDLKHNGYLFGMVWSSAGDILATCSTYGTIRLWDTTHNDSWPLIQELQDETEEKIEEFYVMRFTPDDRHLFAAGKLKHRNRWSEEDDDNEVAPGPIKLFDVVSGKVIAKFENHTEEILCLKMVLFKEENYLLSASQDGYIIKWHFDSTWTKCLGTKRIDEVTTNMALGLSFLPNCGNKYFASAADEGIKIYDFENEVLLQRFDDLYTSYCDCIKFIRPRDFPEEDGVYYLITRGVELLSQDEPAKPLQNNTCHLRKLIAPKKACPAKDAFRLETVTTFQHESYKANSWPVRVTSNGVYIAAPSVQGEVFIWHLKTGRLNCILAFHEDRECRDVTFHPTRPIVVSCCDDSTAKIYIQDPPYDDYQEEEEVEVDIEGGADVVVRQTPIVVDEKAGSSASASSSSSASTSLETFHLSKSNGNGKSVGRKTRKKKEEDEEDDDEDEEEEIEEEEREEEEEEEEEGAQQRKEQATERMNVEGTPELEEAWGKLETQTANLEKAKKKLSEEKKKLNAEKKELAKERKELEEERRMFEKEKREFERAKREYEREQEKERIWLVERKKELEKGAE